MYTFFRENRECCTLSSIILSSPTALKTKGDSLNTYKENRKCRDIRLMNQIRKKEKERIVTQLSKKRIG